MIWIFVEVGQICFINSPTKVTQVFIKHKTLSELSVAGKRKTGRREAPSQEILWFWGKFLNLRGNMKKYIRKLCHSQGEFWSACREMNTFSRPDYQYFKQKGDLKLPGCMLKNRNNYFFENIILMYPLFCLQWFY